MTELQAVGLIGGMILGTLGALLVVSIVVYLIGVTEGYGWKWPLE